MERFQPTAEQQRGWQPLTTLSASDALSLAVGLHQSGRLSEAASVYKKILEALPNQPDALHFLGVLLHQLGESQGAVELISKAITVNPDNADAQNNLGNVFKELGRLDEAADAYRKVVALKPDHADAYNNLAILLKEQGKYEEAIAAYQQAIALEPDHADAHHNLGNALGRQGKHEEAIAAYRRAIALKPNHGVAYRSLAEGLSRAGRIDKAIHVIGQWQSFEPDNPIARHLMAACSGREVPQRASDRYVQEIFDEFAGTFDNVLEKLEYRAPELVAAALADRWPTAEGTLDVLDAGCGTGLCGPLLRPYARRLVGVDLSAGMLAKAKEQDVYDDLVKAELTAFLGGVSQAFDLIASADTLVYFGALNPVLAAAATALRPGGRFVFTLERVEDEHPPDGFRLHPHGRYSHTGDYLTRAMAEAGLTACSIKSAVLRKEIGQAVSGIVVVASKDA